MNKFEDIFKEKPTQLTKIAQMKNYVKIWDRFNNDTDYFNIVKSSSTVSTLFCVKRKDNASFLKLSATKYTDSPIKTFEDFQKNKLITLNCLGKSKEEDIQVIITEDLFSDELFDKLLKIKDLPKKKLIESMKYLQKYLKIQKRKNTYQQDFE